MNSANLSAIAIYSLVISAFWLQLDSKSLELLITVHLKLAPIISLRKCSLSMMFVTQHNLEIVPHIPLLIVDLTNWHLACISSTWPGWFGCSSLCSPGQILRQLDQGYVFHWWGYRPEIIWDTILLHNLTNLKCWVETIYFFKLINNFSGIGGIKQILWTLWLSSSSFLKYLKFLQIQNGVIHHPHGKAGSGTDVTRQNMQILVLKKSVFVLIIMINRTIIIGWRIPCGPELPPLFLFKDMNEIPKNLITNILNDSSTHMVVGWIQATSILIFKLPIIWISLRGLFCKKFSISLEWVDPQWKLL